MKKTLLLSAALTMTAWTLCYSQDTIRFPHVEVYPTEKNLERHPHWLLLKMAQDLALKDKLLRENELYRMEVADLDSVAKYFEKALDEAKRISAYHLAMSLNNDRIIFEYEKQAAELAREIKRVKRSRTWTTVGAIALLILVAL